jgi:CRP-like cAMP-binding protein
VLMGHLASAARGAYLTRRGDLQRELYVLLGGRADVCRGGRVIRTLGRGDVVGEMGLVRGLPRSADVVAGEDLEYLVLDEHFLTRLKRRYPWIAANVFLNLAKILSDRLETTTDRLDTTGAHAGLAADQRGTTIENPSADPVAGAAAKEADE